MQANKTPEQDGLTTEFYQFYSPPLKKGSRSTQKKALPDSLTLSYFTLLPKDNQDKTQMKNNRPISLLNVDYKIISKAITGKLQPHNPMSNLVRADQQCSIAGRKVQNHLHFIKDIITYHQGERNVHTRKKHSSEWPTITYSKQ